jgi:hypothetical protein
MALIFMKTIDFYENQSDADGQPVLVNEVGEHGHTSLSDGQIFRRRQGYIGKGCVIWPAEAKNHTSFFSM